MVGRVLGRTLTTLGLLCATLAWTCWVYLRTVGDPTRIERIADAVLADTEARLEISSFLAGQIMDSAGVDPSYRPMVETAVETALGDPRITTDVIDALASEHAHAVGVDDPRDTTIDTAAIVEATRQHLAELDPALAEVIPADAASQVGQITLPKYRPPGAGTTRDLAAPAWGLLAGIAAVLLGISFVAGERRRTVRRIGTWGLLSGIGWLVGPLVLTAAAEQWFPDASATVRVITEEYARTIRLGSGLLVGLGVVALVLWALPIWPSDDRWAVSGHTSAPTTGPQPDWATAQAYRASLAHGHAAPTAPAGVVSAAAPAHPSPAAAGRGGPVDTFVRSGDAPVPGAPPSRPASPATAAVDAIWRATEPGGAPPPAPTSSSTPAPPVDVDPWTAFFGEQR